MTTGKHSVDPAPAGVDRPPGVSDSGASSSGPRTRGGGPYSRVVRVLKAPWTPHPRGWTFLWGHGWEELGVAPAPAGVDPWSATR